MKQWPSFLSLSPAIKRWLFPAKVALGLGVFAWLFFSDRVNFHNLFSAENAWLFIILLFIQVIIFVLSTYRWFLFTRNQGLSVTFKSCLEYAWVGQFFASFLPSFVSSDAVRGYYLASQAQKTTHVALSVIYDRVAALLMVVVFAVSGAVCFYYQLPGLGYIGLGVIFMIFALLTAKGIRTIRPQIFLIRQRTWVTVLLLSAVTLHLKVLSLLVVVHLAMNLEVNLNWLYLTSAGQFFESLPLSPANIGFGHVVFLKIYELLDSAQGAQIYNIYFSAKLLFKISGVAPWLIGGRTSAGG